jgi:hypothetical protein
MCLEGELTVRTTLVIDDDVLAVAKEIAASQRKSVARYSLDWLSERCVQQRRLEKPETECRSRR